MKIDLLTLEFVRWSNIYSIRALPPAYRLKVKENIEILLLKFESTKDERILFLRERLLDVISFMYGEDLSDRWKSFLSMTRILDEIRGEAFEKTFPELTEPYN